MIATIVHDFLDVWRIYDDLVSLGMHYRSAFTFGTITSSLHNPIDSIGLIDGIQAFRGWLSDWLVKIGRFSIFDLVYILVSAPSLSIFDQSTRLCR